MRDYVILNSINLNILRIIRKQFYLITGITDFVNKHNVYKCVCVFVCGQVVVIWLIKIQLWK